MAQIDRFIEAAFQRGGESLCIESGERAVYVKDGQPRTMTSQPATVKQARGLLDPILPPGHNGDLQDEGSFEFVHSSPAGTVKVAVVHGPDLLRFEVTPHAAAAPADGPGAGPAGETLPSPGPPAALPVSAPPEEEGVASAPDPGEPGAAGPAPVTAAPAPAGAAPVKAGQEAPSSPAAHDAMEGLLRKLVEDGCSDLHLNSGNPPFFRKDGEMVTPQGARARDAEQTRELLFSIAGKLSRDQFLERGDTDFGYEIPGLSRFRCNLFMDRQGPGGVFRVIPSEIPSAEDLGLPEAVTSLCDLQKGLVVVTGPTGSGKSTTLAAMVDRINSTRSAHIITIEDPIEFVHRNKKCLVNQREVGVHTEGFKTALRAALREDPDIVLVGEMRDLETVAIAIETAETGHLVFGTLHTNTAASTVDRIIDQFSADRQGQVRTMLSESLKGVIAQTLCRKKGGGRVAAMEILLMTPAISNLIREAKTFQIPSLMQTGRGAGMQLMNDALLELVRKGLVEPEEALAKSTSRADLEAALQRARAGV